MKKAFTLIELLVVIAIIAILAAILFPVFAQAKTAAKKTQSISNQKQIGLAILMYAGDSEDTYPRNDDCVVGSSLNPANNVPGAVTGNGCSGPFPFRMNHYSWQKWVKPYTKNVDLFWSPAFGKVDPGGIWTNSGEIMSSYALNLSLTGALDTWNKSATTKRQFRDSFIGGHQSALADVAGTMLLMELVSSTINFAPVITHPDDIRQTAYPAAIRELWIPLFKKPINASACQFSTETDPKVVPFAGSIVLGMADGSAKAINVDKFLANTPPTSATGYTGGKTWSCAPTGGAWTLSTAPTWVGSWPMWGIGN